MNYLKHLVKKRRRSNLVLLFLLLWVGISLDAYSSTTQKKTVSGYVTEKITGETLVGVAVQIKGTYTGTITDFEGKYSVEVNSEEDILVFTFIGKRTIERPIKGINTLDIIMEDDARMLNEVVIQVGYMTQRKADLTGSVAVASASDLAQNPSTNALKSLQGKLPGVYITADGSPGSNVVVQIRGLTSLNAQPAPLIVLDGLAGDYNLRDINPANIESLQVLKDASAASIYGSRAAGGVIIIETKKGKEGTTQVSYDGRLQLSMWANKPNLLNTDQYGRALWQAWANDGKLDQIEQGVRYYKYDWGYDSNNHPELFSLQPVEWLNNAQTMRPADTNWIDEIARTGVSQNHQISISSGNEHSRSFFNLGYEDTQGIQIETFWEKFSARMNTEFTLLNKRLKIGENFELNYMNYREANETSWAVMEPPIIPVYTETGGWGGASLDVGMDDYRNPVKNLKLGKENVNKFLKLIGNAYADLMITKELRARTSFGIDCRGGYYRFIDPIWEEADGAGRIEEYNYVRNNQDHFLEYQWTNQLNYSKRIGNHSIDAVGGIEFSKAESENFYARKNGLLLEDRDYAFLDVASGDLVTQATGSGNEYALFSYFGKANYSYNSKYLASVTLRYDGSSKFGMENQWATFPAFSLGWRMKSESFLEDVNFLSDLKLRFSWGKNGNSAIPTGWLQNSYLASYDDTSYDLNGMGSGSLMSGYYKFRTGNSNLKWETVAQTNYGIDFGFFDQRINGAIDYFYKKTTDMLYKPEYMAAIGEGGYRYVNGPSMDNRGIEILLNYSGKPSASGINYNISANFATFKNKILDLPESVRSVYGGNGMLDDMIGRPYSSFYGYVADGIFKTQEEVDNSPQQSGKGIGRIRYKDLDGDGNITSQYDRTWIGVGDPDFTFGVNFQADYKNFDASLFFQGVYGNQVWDEWLEYSDFWNISTRNNKNHLAGVFNAWTPQNPNSNIPALSTQNLNDEARSSTYFIRDGSYLKLRSLELGYTLPRSVLKKFIINRCRVYASANNLFTIKKWWGDDKFSGPDPENVSFGYVVPFTMTLGVNLTF